MTEENRTYITHLKVTDVPWHRLTTAYGRGTDFPAHLTVLEQMRDLASVKESLYELTTNMEHQSTRMYWCKSRQSLPSLLPRCWNCCKGGYTDV